MIGERIRAYRQNRGIKVAEFATLIGISQGSLSDIENQKTKPSSETIESLVRNTDIDARWLLVGEGAAPEQNRLDSKTQEVISIMMRSDEKVKANILRDAKKEKLYSEVALLKKFKHLNETGIICINLLLQLFLPIQIVLVAVGFGFLTGPTALKIIAGIVFSWSLVVPIIRSFPVETVWWLKHRYCSFVRFRSPYFGEL